MTALEWRPVVGFEGLYEVSSEGHVRRVGPTKGARVGRCLNPTHGGRGPYYFVTLRRNGRSHSPVVHRLVAAAFIGPCPDGHEVNHKDGTKRNNRVENLEYVTRSQNTKHAHDMGLFPSSRAKRALKALEACACAHCQSLLDRIDGKERQAS